MPGRALKCHAQFEPDVIALEPLFDVQFRQPLDLRHQIVLADLSDERDNRADADGAAFEFAQHGAAAAVAGNLLVVERGSANADDAELSNGQMFGGSGWRGGEDGEDAYLPSRKLRGRHQP